MAVSAGGQVERLGNDDYIHAPHGLYATNIADRWLGIAIGSDSEWRAFVTISGLAALFADPRFRNAKGRHTNRRALDGAVSAWSATQDAEDAVERLQRAGIAAHISWNTRDLVTDPHLRKRGAIIDVSDSEGGARAAVGFPGRFSGSEAASITRGTPKLGEHEDYVYGELLGMGRREIDSLVEQQIIY